MIKLAVAHDIGRVNIKKIVQTQPMLPSDNTFLMVLEYLKSVEQFFELLQYIQKSKKTKLQIFPFYNIDMMK